MDTNTLIGIAVAAVFIGGIAYKVIKSKKKKSSSTGTGGTGGTGTNPRNKLH